MAAPGEKESTLTTPPRFSCMFSFSFRNIHPWLPSAFVDMLTRMRFGQLDDYSIKKFQELARPVDDFSGLMPTELYPRREDVDAANATRLKQLNTEAMTYQSQDSMFSSSPLLIFLSSFIMQGLMAFSIWLSFLFRWINCQPGAAAARARQFPCRATASAESRRPSDAHQEPRRRLRQRFDRYRDGLLY